MQARIDAFCITRVTPPLRSEALGATVHSRLALPRERIDLAAPLWRATVHRWPRAALAHTGAGVSVQAAPWPRGVFASRRQPRLPLPYHAIVCAFAISASLASSWAGTEALSLYKAANHCVFAGTRG